MTEPTDAPVPASATDARGSADSSPAGPGPGADGWSTDRQGRSYAPAKGRSGVVYRRGNETPSEAQARDAKAQAKDKPPKRKKAPTVAKAPAPTTTDLKELEFLVCEALKSPAMIPLALGDEWPANHMLQQAPVFARNLTKASEHNPWLRARLQAMTTGEDFLIKLITTGAVAGAAFMYAVPVLLYYVRPDFVPEPAIEMLGIPDRDEIKRQQAEELARASAESAQRAAANGPVAAAA
jgi:hypothetical protein